MAAAEVVFPSLHKIITGHSFIKGMSLFIGKDYNIIKE
jgi:hypothetical protein